MFRNSLTAFLVILCVSCGLEDYPYLAPVPPDNIHPVLNERATIYLPSVDSNDIYFKNFAVYYRIYISDLLASSQILLTQESLKDINSTLSADYFAIEPSTVTSNNMATNVGSLFSNRNYRSFSLEGASVDSVLSSRNGQTITIDFQTTATNPVPRLVFNDTSYILTRSNGNGLFAPKPTHRYFVNAADLNSSENVSATVNADVVNKSDIKEGNRYTYAAMYIVAVGFNSANLAPIYSAPAFVNIFLLPAPDFLPGGGTE
jgi:hypothetical protein